jgi:hypothetical protein
MYLCYIDESGTSNIPGNTSHYVFAGISIPVWHWKDCDVEIRTIKDKYYPKGAEIHDNNQTVEKKLTDLMKPFHQKGTLFTRIDHIIETPLFVDS